MSWQKQWTTTEAGKILAIRLCNHKMWYCAAGQGKKTFNHTQYWEVVKNFKRFRIIPTGPKVVVNEMPLHDSPASDSPMDSLMSQDSPIQREPRPIGRKAVKVKRGFSLMEMLRDKGGVWEKIVGKLGSGRFVEVVLGGGAELSHEQE
ncbi:unnamed protein product [Prunus armeniaca]